MGAAAINSILANVIAEEIAHSRASVIQEQIVALKQPSPSPYAARLSPQVQQASAILRLGERVKLQNLQLKAYLNDRKGECIRLLDSGRWEVRLDTGEVLAVKPANLEIELEARVTKGDRVVISEEGDSLQCL